MGTRGRPAPAAVRRMVGLMLCVAGALLAAPLAPPAVAAPGTLDTVAATAAEQREGESLTGRLAREEPEAVYPAEPAPEVGRLVEPDEGVRADTESDLIASDSGDTAGLSAEEAALHLEP